MARNLYIVDPKWKFIETLGSTGFDSRFPWRSKQVERWNTARKSYVSTF